MVLGPQFADHGSSSPVSWTQVFAWNTISLPSNIVVGRGRTQVQKMDEHARQCVSCPGAPSPATVLEAASLRRKEEGVAEPPRSLLIFLFLGEQVPPRRRRRLTAGREWSPGASLENRPRCSSDPGLEEVRRPLARPEPVRHPGAWG